MESAIELEDDLEGSEGLGKSVQDQVSCCPVSSHTARHNEAPTSIVEHVLFPSWRVRSSGGR